MTEEREEQRPNSQEQEQTPPAPDPPAQGSESVSYVRETQLPKDREQEPPKRQRR